MRAAAGSKELYVEEHGEGDPLLLVEGLGQAMWAWREQVPVFAQSFLTITFDTRGTGRSWMPTEPYGIADLAEDAAGVLGGRTAHVVGLSMGGYVALTLALAHPELVRSLVLVGTGAGGADRVPRPDRVREAFAAAMGLPPEEFGRRTMPYTFASGWAERNADRYDEILAARLERPTSYETIEAPALVIHGDEDLIVPVENGRMLAARLPNVRYEELPGRGHNLPLEDPETFNPLVVDFLDSVNG